AALQHLPGNQRAVLILRDVLGFSARQCADMLTTTVPSVNSALQRARSAVSSRVSDRTQQATLRTLGDRGLRDLVARYVEAWERCDVDAFTALLVQDATFAMPPLSTWYGSRDAIAVWARTSSLSGDWQWKVIPTRANAQPALAFYSWNETAAVYEPFALNVLTLRGGLVSDVTAFIVRSTADAEETAYQRFPEQPLDRARFGGIFARLGLPAQLGRST
ncbi:MAG TPA: sigma factor-like helix-turn-helix DNA-binding protein, partial [Mycobacteriales bacterium]|nr:sigma factor-like helix-turn-helix DNA-binding protein [Mycobacteriales bacterium]